ncbi:MAG: ABC transporter ATP-binding protein/permease [Chloroflexi bacterium]|nr:ABC transporter ATP-binding protein/permease [Chloroflexota bacterium]
MGFSIGSASAEMGPRQSLESYSDKVDGQVFNVGIVVRLLAYVRPYWCRMLLALIAMLATTGLTLLVPYLVKIAIDEAIVEADQSRLNLLAVFMLLASLGIYVTSALQDYLLSWVGQRVLADLRADLFTHLQRLSLGYHDKHIVGVTISRVISDVSVINQLLSQGLVTLLGDTLLLGSIVVVMLSLNAQLALITFSIIPVMFLATAVYARRAKVAFRRTRERVAALVGNLAEDLSGIRVIQAFAQERVSQEHFEEVNRANRDVNIDAVTLSFVFLPTVEFLGMLATAIVLWFGGRAATDGDITLGVVVAFLAYVTRFFQPVQELSQLYATMQTAMAGGERVLQLLKTEPEVLDSEDALEMSAIEGRIELRDVGFEYMASLPVLHNVNLEIGAGDTVALVGPTGAGKSTIANLVTRFYDVTSGAVLIDDIDVRTVTQRSLRRQMGLVSQDPFLFAGTIADNIRFGKPDASPEEIEAAARVANVDNFVEMLPDRYDTRILEDGANLSVGQRQLISIARAVLADPRILIMDEATSSVDVVTETLIQEALERLLEDRTAIVIAHRLSTIINADQICVIHNGEIVEKGRHDELLALGGLYETLYERQFVGEPS